jgi:hypothetical protein
MSWSSGYTTDIAYTHGYYAEISPAHMSFALLLAGYAAPSKDNARYLELGYGQGMSLNMHAAANQGDFWGTDFNPSHAANAQSLAASHGAKVTILDESFGELAKRDDLGQFDYITLHGIWSWISADVRAEINHILRRHLKVGGVVYNSYNTLPGWSVALPIRHLLALHADTAGSEAEGILGRIDKSLQFGKKLVEVQARFFTNNPAAGGRLDAIANQNRNYVAHEYFNSYWDPSTFSDMHATMADNKLSYATSATLLEQVDGLNFTQPQRELLAPITHPVLRESTKDYLSNQQFRRDLYTRGARRLSSMEQIDALQRTRFALVRPKEDVTLKVVTGLGELTLKAELYEPLVELLASDGYRPKSILEMRQLPAYASLPMGPLLESLIVLYAGQHVALAQDPAVVDAVEKRTQALTSHLMEKSRLSGDVAFLPSPVTGGGLMVPRFEQLFLLAAKDGKSKPADWAQFAWKIISDQGQKLLLEGKIIEAPEENLKELERQAKAFSGDRLNILKMLRIA